MSGSKAVQGALASGAPIISGKNVKTGHQATQKGWSTSATYQRKGNKILGTSVQLLWYDNKR